MISKFEKKELAKALIATALAFGILIWSSGNSFIFSFFVALLTVGLGFVLHELAHKYVAIKFKKNAEFRANDTMLVASLIMSFFGFIFAAPGAVWISGHVTKKENGLISVAGPLTNIVLAILFLPLVLIVPKIAMYGFMINAWLALFNMIPLFGFDGQKVITWSKPVYFVVGLIALLLNIFNILLPRLIEVA